MSTPFPDSDDARAPEQLPTPSSEVRPVVTGGRIVRANGVDLCVETFGDPADPTILLVDNSMLSWEDEFCERLAAGSRFIVRYDLRNTGRSVSYDSDAPPYTLRDLVADVVGLLDALGLVPHSTNYFQEISSTACCKSTWVTRMYTGVVSSGARSIICTMW